MVLGGQAHLKGIMHISSNPLSRKHVTPRIPPENLRSINKFSGGILGSTGFLERGLLEMCMIPFNLYTCTLSILLNLTSLLSSRQSFINADFPLDGNASAAENFCRNPKRNLRSKPWCLTQDPKVEWEYCSLSMCQGKGAVIIYGNQGGRRNPSREWSLFMATRGAVVSV